MSRFKPFPSIRTERLHLRRLTEQDAITLYNYMSDKSNFEFVHMNPHSSISETKKYIERMNNGLDEGKWIIWAIEGEEEQGLIGTISLWNFKNDQAEFGYSIFPHYRRNGYMSEVIKSVSLYAFNDLELSRVYAYTSHFNEPSKLLLKHLDFTFEDTIVDEYSNGALMDVYYTSEV